MNRNKRFLGLFQGLVVITSLLFAGCQPASTPSPAIPLTVWTIQGEALVQRDGKGDFTALKSGDSLSVAACLRVPVEGSVELRDARSFLVVGSGTEVTIETLSNDAAVTRTQVRLAKGILYAEAEKPLVPGMVEVLTPGGSASIQGSGMIISVSGSMTTVGCTSGEASLTAGGTTQVLRPGEASTFVSSGVPSKPQSIDEKLFGDNPIMMEAISGVIHVPVVITGTIIPTMAEPTRKPTSTITATLKATWTPMVLGDTSTPQATSAGSLRRPSSTVDPALNGGLTPEEQVNQGEHTYAVACQSFGTCVCDSALAQPSVTMTIMIDRSSVSLAAKDGQLSYPRAAPNLFRITQNNIVADVTFLSEGWELYVEKDGNACSIQTYTRQ